MKYKKIHVYLQVACASRIGANELAEIHRCTYSENLLAKSVNIAKSLFAWTYDK